MQGSGKRAERDKAAAGAEFDADEGRSSSRKTGTADEGHPLRARSRVGFPAPAMTDEPRSREGGRGSGSRGGAGSGVGRGVAFGSAVNAVGVA